MPTHWLRRRASRAGSSALLVLAVACSGGNGDAGACAQPVREELDPAHLFHVLDPTEARFRTDPPTSGPHTSGPAPTGSLDRPLLGAVQVAILERGDVLVQYQPDVPEADRSALVALAGERTVVAPQPALPAPIIATAWTYKLSCDALDLAAIGRFVDQHAGRSTGH